MSVDSSIKIANRPKEVVLIWSTTWNLISLDKSLINLKVVLLESETNASFFGTFFQHYQPFLERFRIRLDYCFCNGVGRFLFCNLRPLHMKLQQSCSLF